MSRGGEGHYQSKSRTWRPPRSPPSLHLSGKEHVYPSCYQTDISGRQSGVRAGQKVEERATGKERERERGGGYDNWDVKGEKRVKKMKRNG